MNFRLLILRSTTAAAVLAVASAVIAAGSSRRKAPANPIQLDFNIEGPERRVAMTEEGQAWEIAVKFQMIKHAEVAIAADLPAQGRFQVEQSNAEVLVDVKEVRADGKHGAARIVSRVQPMSEADALRRARETVNKIWDPVYKQYLEEGKSLDKKQLQDYAKKHDLPLPNKYRADENELRDWYAKDRALKKLLPDIRQGLADAAQRKPQWVTPRDKTRWAKVENLSILDDYVNLLEHEIINDYLNACKLGTETNSTNFRIKLDVRLNAVYLVVSGKVCEGAEELTTISRGLGPQEIAALRNALSVHLRCRFYPEVDPADPNAQWFHGQRVACRAQGVASIRLEGRLNPAEHDRVDWWLLEGYNPDSVTMEVVKKGAFRVESPVATKLGAALRVVATGEEATDYAVEFRPTGKTHGKLKVIIYESANTANTKFPY